jgi:hypothetical protein
MKGLSLLRKGLLLLWRDMSQERVYPLGYRVYSELESYYIESATIYYY